MTGIEYLRDLCKRNVLGGTDWAEVGHTMADAALELDERLSRLEKPHVSPPLWPPEYPTG